MNFAAILGEVRFQFFRLRFHFEAVDPLRFPPGTSANTVRGAFGSILRKIACTPKCDATAHHPECAYARIFEPRALHHSGPSGLAEWPRPFVFRTRHLDGCVVEPGEGFSFDVHLFAVNDPVLPYFVEALSRLSGEGLGRGRGRANLKSVEQLAVDGRVLGSVWDNHKFTPMLEPAAIMLAPGSTPVGTARVRFVTPTELKCRNGLAGRPEFPVLFARMRDRISTLRTLYGPGPLEIDFRAMGARASRIAMTHCDLREEHATRRSTRSAQIHPLGGFTGEVEYQGDLTEFLPYLRAARWTGVGRQTVWGKGEMHVLE